METLLKKSLPFIGIFVFALIIGAVTFGNHSATKAEAQLEMPQEEKSWIDSITTGGKQWQKEKAIEDAAHTARVELEGTMGPLRLSLCNRYKVTIDKNFAVQPATTCPGIVYDQTPSDFQ